MDDMIVKPGFSLQRLESYEVFLIRRKDFTNPLFFFKEMDHDLDDYRLTKWTAIQMQARMFTSEKDVETFKAKFLRVYPCEIIRIRH